MYINRDKLKEITKCDYYNGDLIHGRFAYDFFKERTLPTGNIIAFRSPMEVKESGMIDKEDLTRSDFIFSDDAINFCWEIPTLDKLGAVFFQRYFNTGIAFIIQQIKDCEIEIDGDDIFIIDSNFVRKSIAQPKGKCSVSITYSNNNVAIGHTGININTGDKAPVHAYSLKFTDKQIDTFVNEVIDTFYEYTNDAWLASSKLTL